MQTINSKHFFAVTSPKKYFHNSLYEKFDISSKNNISPNSFSLLAQNSHYFLQIQPENISVGVNDHFSFTFSNSILKNPSSIRFHFKNVDFTVLSPKGFEIDIYTSNKYINLQQNSLFFQGNFNPNPLNHINDCMISFYYPNPCSFMAQIKGKHHVIGTSIEFLPNVSLYSYFGMLNFKNAKFRLCYSNCDTKILNSILSVLSKYKSSLFSVTGTFSLNTMSFGPTMNTQTDHSVIALSDYVTMLYRFKAKLNLSKICSLGLTLRFPEVLSFISPSNFDSFEIRFKWPKNSNRNMESTSVQYLPHIGHHRNGIYSNYNKYNDSVLTSFSISKNQTAFHSRIFEVGNIHEFDVNLKYNWEIEKYSIGMAIITK